MVAVEQNDAVAEIGRNVTGVQGDVGNLDDLDRRVEAVTAHTGRVGVLFASAGNHTSDEPFGAVTEPSFDVNVQGTFGTVQKLPPLMPDGASIILNGSAAAVQGGPGSTVYAASKNRPAVMCPHADHRSEGAAHPLHFGRGGKFFDPATRLGRDVFLQRIPGILNEYWGRGREFC